MASRIPPSAQKRFWTRNGPLISSVIAIVDTGPLFAAADQADRANARSIEVFQRPDLRFVIPSPVVTEAAYLIGKRLGARAEARFIRAISDYDIELPTPRDWHRIADLIEQYASFPLGVVDASVVALAERLGTDLVVTLDQRHFRAIRPRHCPAFRLLPNGDEADANVLTR